MWMAAALAAEPGEVRAGVDLGAILDLPDRASGEHTRFGPGPSIAVPVRIALSERARLRFQLRGEMASGRDRLLWTERVAGEDLLLYDDDHLAIPVVVAGTVGAEIAVPLGTGGVELALGAETGGAWVSTFHSLGGPTQPLLDPEQNELDDPGNIDPYTRQLAWVSGLDATVAVPFGEGLHLTLRTGYSGAFLNARPLRKTPAALDAHRAAYGWNPLRIAVGLERTL
jgi:hypothetical protein